MAALRSIFLPLLIGLLFFAAVRYARTQNPQPRTAQLGSVPAAR